MIRSIKPQVNDIICVLVGAIFIYALTGGLPSQYSEEVKVSNVVSALKLPDSLSRASSADSYQQLLSLYEPYYTPPKKTDVLTSKEEAESKTAQQELVGDTNIYTLQATFLGESNLAVIQVRSKQGEIVDTKLAKQGDLVSGYRIKGISRTQISLISQKTQQELILKLFDRNKNPNKTTE